MATASIGTKAAGKNADDVAKASGKWSWFGKKGLVAAGAAYATWKLASPEEAAKDISAILKLTPGVSDELANSTAEWAQEQLAGLPPAQAKQWIAKNLVDSEGRANLVGDLADGATVATKETAQIGADTKFEGKMALFENFAEWVSSWFGHENGFLMSVINNLRGQQQGKGSVANNGGELVELNNPEDPGLHGADGLVGEVAPSAIQAKFSAAGTIADAGAALDLLVDADPEFADEALAIRDNSELMQAFTDTVMPAGGDVAANAMDFHSTVKDKGFKFAMGGN